MASRGRDFDALIVGAGFSGSVCARQLADHGWRVLLVDKRNHIGGNAYDRFDEHGVLVHPYGPHIFHTSSKRIFEYLSRFTAWRFYEHRVRAVVDNKLYPIPINRTTINELYGLKLDEKGIADYLDAVRERFPQITNSEELVLSSVGRDLCEKFFRGYTLKQWGLDLSQLSAGVAARIPTRTNDDDRYFGDTYQFMPAEGYSVLFRNLLDHPNIGMSLGTDFFDLEWRQVASRVVYTGPIDQFYGYRFGHLPYRSLAFEHSHHPQAFYQSVGTVNYPVSEAFTRITEFKHLTGQKVEGTSIVREYPRAQGEPFYPIPRPENEALFKRYDALAGAEVDVHFVGRLAQYRYYNLDQVVGAALALAERLTERPAVALAAN